MEMIAYCGINCSECKAYIATKQNDDSLRKQIAETWSKELGIEMKIEDINCDGCLVTDGKHINYCNICEIRKCGTQKGVENCAFCVEYSCEKLGKFHEQAPKAKQTLQEIRRKTRKAK